jgi:hypothetical protein
MKTKIEVDESTAKFFYDQIMGSYPGHMSMIPNSPTLRSLLLAHGVKDEDTFNEFLVQVADKLEGYKLTF